MDQYVDKKYYKSDVTAEIIRCAQEVHRTLGYGFPEVIYQRALAIEFSKSDLIFEKEKETKIFYRGEIVGKRRVDFIVSGDIMVELKAVAELDNSAISQVLNYIDAYGVKLGLLLNFGGERLEIRRFIK